MDAVELAAVVSAIVLARWSEIPEAITPLEGGMNSATVSVRLSRGRFVAKWVPLKNRDALHAGAAAAVLMSAGGLSAGAPLSTDSGDLSVEVGSGVLSLLEWVPGSALTGRSDQDQRQIARTLAKAHGMETREVTRRPFFEWIHGSAPGLGAEPWVRPAVHAVCNEYALLPPVTWGILHTDPAPEAFLYDELTDSVGLIDWAGSTRGPLLYDVASALMYLGGIKRGSTFLGEYALCGSIFSDEIDSHLSAFRRFRGAVQAVYFSQRLLADDLTGIADGSENWKGLHDAHEILRELGVTKADLGYTSFL